MLLGIDLGGTKIEGIVLKSKENPEEVIRHRVDTEEEKGYSQVISNIKSLVDSIESPQLKACLLYTSPSPRD